MLKLIISDTHLSMGNRLGHFNPFEDFHDDDALVSFLRYYSTGEYAKEEVELILDGDIFDPLAVEVNGGFPERISSGIGVLKMSRCLEGHASVVAAMREFLAVPGKRITYIMGNHDLEVAFPAVQQLLRTVLGGPEASERIRFRIYEPWYDLPGGVRVCHGNQFEALNRVDLKHLFLTKGYSEPILNLPWGSIFLLKVLLPVKQERPYMTLVHPFSRYLALALVTDTKVAAPATARAVYHFLRTRFVEAHKRAASMRETVRILREEAVVTPDLEVVAASMMRDNPGLRAVIMGHSHEAKIRRMGNRGVYVNTGTWTKYVSLDLPDFGAHTRLTYAKVDYRGGGPSPRVGLFQWFGPVEALRELKY